MTTLKGKFRKNRRKPAGDRKGEPAAGKLLEAAHLMNTSSHFEKTVLISGLGPPQAARRFSRNETYIQASIAN